MTRSILLIEDEARLRASLSELLRRDNWLVTTAADGRSGIESYERDRPDVVVTDLQMPELAGMQVLDIIRQRDPEATVVVLTGYADVATAVEAMRLGAENFLTKPVDSGHLRQALDRAHEKSELRRRNRYFAERQTASVGPESLGSSGIMRERGAQADVLAQGEAPILLLGETGTGKGHFAKAIHARSPRARAPFVDVNCASLTATFLESELFGHEKGAFTDAKAQKRGLFEMAHTGTLFLDEIGELALELQPKLLKVLESGCFRRVGGTHEIEVDVRIVAATNLDLESAVACRRFRADLFYRLSVLPLTVPPLRERGREEIVDLAFRLLADLRRKMRRGPERISPEALALLLRYGWPGNVRQLRNLLERVLLVAGDAAEVIPAHLPPELHLAKGAPGPSDSPLKTLAEAERLHIERAIEHFAGNRAQAARALGITRGTLYKRLREHGLERVGRE
jgi:DNA-binding NtrC family response regulator